MISYGMLMGASIPFIIKMIKNLGYSDGFVLAAASMTSLGAILTLRFWGTLADRFGNRAIFSLSHMGMVVAMLMWIVIDKSQFGAVLIFILFLFTSIFNSGNGIAQTRYLINNIPSDKQYCIVIINTIAVFSVAIGPVLGGLFLKLTEGHTFSSGALNMNNYHIFFVINAALFVIPHNLRKRLRVENEVPTNEVVAIVTRPLMNIMGPFAKIGKHKSDENNKIEN